MHERIKKYFHICANACAIQATCPSCNHLTREYTCPQCGWIGVHDVSADITGVVPTITEPDELDEYLAWEYGGWLSFEDQEDL